MHCSGPFNVGVIVNCAATPTPAGAFGRGSVPSCAKPVFLWLPSQNGLFFEVPQRHSAMRVSVTHAFALPEREVAANVRWDRWR